MSISIEPAKTTIFDGDEVDRYNLPDGFGNPLLCVDITKDITGYVAEWESERSSSSFADFVRETLEPGKVDFAKVTQSLPEGESEPVRIGGLKFFEERWEDALSGEITYISVESTDYDIAWEQWDEGNHIILTSRVDDHRYIDKYFDNSVSNDVIPEGVLNKTISQAKSVIDKKSELYE